MISYNWTISQLEVKPQAGDVQDLVVTVHWRLDGVDGEHSAGVYGTVATKPYEAGAPFVPYDSLTKEIVVGWVEDALGEQVQSYKDSIATQIANLINPTIVTPPLPWASN